MLFTGVLSSVNSFEFVASSASGCLLGFFFGKKEREGNPSLKLFCFESGTSSDGLLELELNTAFRRRGMGELGLLLGLEECFPTELVLALSSLTVSLSESTSIVSTLEPALRSA